MAGMARAGAGRSCPLSRRRRLDTPALLSFVLFPSLPQLVKSVCTKHAQVDDLAGFAQLADAVSHIQNITSIMLRFIANPCEPESQGSVENCRLAMFCCLFARLFD